MLYFKGLSPDTQMQLPPYDSTSLAKLGHLNKIVEVLNGVAGRPRAINATATASINDILSGVITTSSAIAVGITLPDAAPLGVAAGVGPGVGFNFTVDNSASTLIGDVTLTPGAGTTASVGSVLVVAAGAIGIFRLHYIDAANAVIITIA
jgi:hypothetical protein